MKNLAIIPARSGSKGVPGKNITRLGGVPLLWWTIEAAMFAGESEFALLSHPDVPVRLDEAMVDFKPVFDMVLVTSNSYDVLDVARGWESVYNHYRNLPQLYFHKRQPTMAMDHVQTDEVVLDVLRFLEYHGQKFDNICLLQPTSPFRNYQHIYESWLFYRNLNSNPVKQAGCLISGVEIGQIDGYHWYGNDQMSMMVEPMGHNPTFRMGRQWEDPLPTKIYKENGAIYWFDAGEFSLRRFYRMPPFGIYPMNEEDSLDINTMEDWEKAEEKVSLWQKVN